MHRRLDRFAVYKIQIWFHNNIHKEDKTIMVPVLSSVACALVSTLGETLLVCFFFFFFWLKCTHTGSAKVSNALSCVSHITFEVRTWLDSGTKSLVVARDICSGKAFSWWKKLWCSHVLRCEVNPLLVSLGTPDNPTY